MKLNSHIKQAMVLAPIAYFLSSFKTTLIFIVSFIFIDFDHYLLYIYRFKKFTIKEMFKYFDDMWERKGDVYEICIFHTIEFFLVLFILGYWYREFWIILTGFLTHLLFDLYYLYRHDVIFTRAFSFTEYLIRRKNIQKR